MHACSCCLPSWSAWCSSSSLGPGPALTLGAQDLDGAGAQQLAAASSRPDIPPTPDSPGAGTTLWTCAFVTTFFCWHLGLAAVMLAAIYGLCSLWHLRFSSWKRAPGAEYQPSRAPYVRAVKSLRSSGQGPTARRGCLGTESISALHPL